MKHLFAMMMFITVMYIDIVDSPTDKTKSYILVEYDNGIVDRLQVDRNRFNKDNTEAVTKAAMQMIKARLGE